MNDSLKNKYALVTGASSGIGMDFAHILAENGCHLIIAARRIERLQKLKDTLQEKFGIKVEVISMDLSLPTAPQILYEEVKLKNIQVDVLINNAGVGIFGNFIDILLEQEINMLNLNILNLVSITKLFVKDMVSLNFGYVLNVASVAAYQPMAAYASYCASKSFVLSFTEALNYELKNTQVNITALSPGDTESDFFETAGQKKLSHTHKQGMMKSYPVAKAGIEAMLIGKPNVIPGWINTISAFFFRLLPRRLTMTMIDSIYMKGER